MKQITGKEVLDGLDEMIEQAPEVGLCALPFKLIRAGVEGLIAERDELMGYRTPKMVSPHTIYEGRCPRCRAVFLDSSTNYCGNCGQALEWDKKDGTR